MGFKSLKQTIETTQPQSISLDVFDTLLLRTWHPEKWRFWVFARSSAKIISTHKLNCTRIYYYSLRMYYTKILRHAATHHKNDPEASYEKIHQHILSHIAHAQNVKLSTIQIQKIIKSILHTELEIEKSKFLRANTKLQDLLESLSHRPYYFFISDMYLPATAVKNLLNHFDYTITKGVSSSDEQCGKYSSRLFYCLQKKFPEYQFSTSLHVGDHKVSDFSSPNSLGIHAIYLHPVSLKLRRLAGKLAYLPILKLVLHKSTKSATESYQTYTHTVASIENQSSTSYARNIGRILAPALIYYLHYLNTHAQTTKQKLVFISSESSKLIELSSALGFKKPLSLPKLSRTSALKAYSYTLHQKNIGYIEQIPMIEKILRRKDPIEALITLGAFQKNDTTHQFISNKKVFQQTISQPRLTKQLKQSHTKLIRDFSALTSNRNLDSIILADVGWNNTIQILSEQALNAANFKGSLHGMYFGLTGSNIFSNAINPSSTGIIFNSLKGHNKYLYQPEVWESFLNSDNPDSPIAAAILEGIKEVIADYNHSQLSPDMYFKASLPQLLSLLKKPNKQSIEVLSLLQFDYGVGSEVPVSLIDTSHSRLYAYKLLLTNRSQFKHFYQNQAWKWGAANYYHFKILYRLYRIKTHKPSF